jgi:hypothetical protein
VAPACQRDITPWTDHSVADASDVLMAQGRVACRRSIPARPRDMAASGVRKRVGRWIGTERSQAGGGNLQSCRSVIAGSFRGPAQLPSHSLSDVVITAVSPRIWRLGSTPRARAACPLDQRLFLPTYRHHHLLSLAPEAPDPELVVVGDPAPVPPALRSERPEVWQQRHDARENARAASTAPVASADWMEVPVRTRSKRGTVQRWRGKRLASVRRGMAHVDQLPSRELDGDSAFTKAKDCVGVTMSTIQWKYWSP